MNRILLQEIVKHIFANFAIIPSTFVNLDASNSLMHPTYLLNERLNFTLDQQTIRNKIWGCQLSVSSQEIKVLLGDCAQTKDIPEFALIIQPKDLPTYGLYLLNHMDFDNEAQLACSINGKDWLDCSTFLQATFLTGMEQLRDLGLAWNKCIDYQAQYQGLMSFIKFHALTFREQNG